MFIKEQELYDFYVNSIENLLKDYEPGRPNMKPDVLSQMVAIEKRRRKDIEEAHTQATNAPFITFTKDNEPPQKLSMEQVVTILQQQQAQINHLTNILKGKDQEIEYLTNELTKKTIKED